MSQLQIEISQASAFLNQEIYIQMKAKAAACQKQLLFQTGPGNDFLGWVNLPSETDPELLTEIEEIAENWKELDVCVVIGIGGSYLGAKAVYEALSHSFTSKRTANAPEMVFAGHHMNDDYYHDLLDFLADKKFGIVVISKSGTTTEPAIAFRILKQFLENQVGAQSKEYILCITDANKGALRTLADQEGYKSFVIPDNVGGRFSVLTPVGLLPLAICGVDIQALMQGAKDMAGQLQNNASFENNQALAYAAIRNTLYHQNYTTEIMVNYQAKLGYFSEWWKQLYGESEGKDGKGIFPASVVNSTDLHSMGQFIQDGTRNLFETVITVESTNNEMLVPNASQDIDGLNYLAGKSVQYVNKKAEIGTTLAHIDGKVPVLTIILPKIDAYNMGSLIYFFEFACGISGYMLEVNPFDQPGVEAYKANMFALLDKPGHEEASKAIKERL